MPVDERFEKIKKLKPITSEAVKEALGLKTRREAQRLLRQYVKEGKLKFVGRQGRLKVFEPA